MPATPHPLRICAPESALDPEEPRAQPIRQTNVDGLSTTEFALNQDSPEGRAVGSLWLGREGIPMRCVGKFEIGNGKLTTIDCELRHVEIGEDDAALFEIPRDFTRLPPEPAMIAALSQGRLRSGQLYAFLKAAKPLRD